MPCAVWVYLENLTSWVKGAKFRRQHPIGKFILDFYCHEVKLAIELDGGGHAEDQQKRYDEQRTRALESEGIRVLRFWNHEVLTKTGTVLEVIWNALEQTPHPNPLPKGEGTKQEETISKRRPLRMGEGIKHDYALPIGEDNIVAGHPLPTIESTSKNSLPLPTVESTSRNLLPLPLGEGRGEGVRKVIKEQPASLLKEKFITGKYEGNKWGGKYLRAPDIFFTILEKGKGKLVRLGDIAEVRFGIKTGANDFFFLDDYKIEKWGIEKEFLKPVLKNPRESKNIILKPSDLKYKILMCHKEKKELKGTNTLKYVEWGEKQGFHERPSCSSRRRWWDLGIWEYADSFWMESINDVNRVYINDSKLFESDKFYGVTFHNRENAEYYSLLLNGTLYCLFRELKGFAGMGEGVLKLPVYDVKDIYFLVPSKRKEIKINREFASIFTELGINPAHPVREQKPNPLPDRKALDDIVFDILGLTEDERNEVYWAVCELVKNRLDKARSV